MQRHAMTSTIATCTPTRCILSRPTTTARSGEMEHCRLSASKLLRLVSTFQTKFAVPAICERKQRQPDTSADGTRRRLYSRKSSIMLGAIAYHFSCTARRVTPTLFYGARIPPGHALQSSLGHLPADQPAGEAPGDQFIVRVVVRSLGQGPSPIGVGEFQWSCRRSGRPWSWWRNGRRLLNRGWMAA